MFWCYQIAASLKSLGLVPGTFLYPRHITIYVNTSDVNLSTILIIPGRNNFSIRVHMTWESSWAQREFISLRNPKGFTFHFREGCPHLFFWKGEGGEERSNPIIRNLVVNYFEYWGYYWPIINDPKKDTRQSSINPKSCKSQPVALDVALEKSWETEGVVGWFPIKREKLQKIDRTSFPYEKGMIHIAVVTLVAVVVVVLIAMSIDWRAWEDCM